MTDTTTTLVVAHDIPSVRVLETVLGQVGHQVIFASNEDETADLAEKHEVALALVQAGWDGELEIELLKRVSEVHPSAGLVLLAEPGTVRSALAAFAVGVQHTLFLPLADFEAIKRIVADTLAERRGPGEDELQAGWSLESDSEEADPTPASEIRVLLADADDQEREELGTALDALGCPVTRATCAQEALLRLSRDAHDVLVVGYDMGDMTADDVLLRARRVDESIAVVVTAPEPTLSMTTAIIRRGATAFVSKPLKMPAMTAKAILRYGRQAQKKQKEASSKTAKGKENA